MTAVALRVPRRAGQIKNMTDQTAATTTPIDIEIKPDAACSLDLAITKPAGAVLTIIKKYGATGAEVPQIVSADATAGTSVELLDIRLRRGDELRVDIDATNGDKKVSAQFSRITGDRA